MVQGGYVSPSSAKTLTVSRRSNVLDKPGRALKSNSTQNSNSTSNNNNNSTISSSIDVSTNHHVCLLIMSHLCLLI